MVFLYLAQGLKDLIKIKQNYKFLYFNLKDNNKYKIN